MKRFKTPTGNKERKKHKKKQKNKPNMIPRRHKITTTENKPKI